MFSGISVLGCDRGYSALNAAGSGGGGTVIGTDRSALVGDSFLWL